MVKKTEKTSNRETHKSRSKHYLTVKALVDRAKYYPLSEAIELLKKVSLARFDNSAEAHLSTVKTGLKAEVKFPHQTGKTQQIRIADETLLKELAKGKINFDLLVTTPELMPKLLKFAKLLGPKGLMPNPKSGTIGADPKKIVANMAGKQTFKTEAKAPVLHAVFGKLSAPTAELEQNFKALVAAIGVKNIKKATIAPTMGPGIKVELGKK